jgi:hypothetical protein
MHAANSLRNVHMSFCNWCCCMNSAGEHTTTAATIASDGVNSNNNSNSDTVYINNGIKEDRDR